MASTIQVDKIQDTGGNTILSSNSTGTFTYNGIAASAIDSGTLAIAQGGTGAATLLAAGLANTPSFSAKLSGDQTIADSSYTKISFASEEWDIGGTYDASTNYRWTPGIVAKYNVTAQDKKLQLAIYKNGSFYADVENIGSSQSGADPTLMINLDLSLSASDYIEAFTYQSTGGGIEVVANYSWFQGQKIIGA